MTESIQIEDFLKVFGNSLPDAIFSYLSNAKSRAQQLEQENLIVSNFGIQSCPLSDDNYSQGYNICTCFATNSILMQSKNVMEFYKKQI